MLYGNRAHLVGRTDWADEPRLWRLDRVRDARILEQTVVRDLDFDLRTYAERSFGTFQEAPVEVVLRFEADAAYDAGNFLFHRTQTTDRNDDGTLTVRIRAGGIDEMSHGDRARRLPANEWDGETARVGNCIAPISPDTRVSDTSAPAKHASSTNRRDRTIVSGTNCPP